MRIAHRHDNGRMPQQFLDRHDIHSISR
jgi:hypothetical protein